MQGSDVEEQNPYVKPVKVLAYFEDELLGPLSSLWQAILWTVRLGQGQKRYGRSS